MIRLSTSFRLHTRNHSNRSSQNNTLSYFEFVEFLKRSITNLVLQLPPTEVFCNSISKKVHIQKNIGGYKKTELEHSKR